MTYNGIASNEIITLPQISTVTGLKFTGRGYKIKNMSWESITIKCSTSNTIKYGNNKSANTINLLSDGYVDLVCTNNDSNWDLLFVSESDYAGAITKTELKLPRYFLGGDSTTKYDTGNDWLLKSVVGDGNYEWISRYAKITYEYQGPAFDISRMATVANVDNLLKQSRKKLI